LILTLDLGTTTTKAVVWDGDGPRAEGRASVDTTFAAGDRAEQDPAAWWPAVVAACAQARAAAPAPFAAVEVVGFAAARQTFVPVTAAGEPLGPAVLWSDRRAVEQGEALAAALGGADAVRRRTGGVLDGAAVAAKAAWMAVHDPDRLRASRWLLTPRDLIVWRMTGEVVTDTTMISAAGLSGPTGEPLAELMAAISDRIPPVLSPHAVAGEVASGPAHELGVPTGVPVVIGAGDRACEVLGTAASPRRPMVAWGTTANVSVPAGSFPDPPPPGVIVTAAASDGWLLEGGLSAAGSLITWLSAIASLDPDVVMHGAAASPVGARGLVSLPWFGGARAPWWSDRARGAFLGLSFEHGAGDLARAVVESVAWEVRRCLEATGSLARPGAVVAPRAGTPSDSLALTGSDVGREPWPQVVAAVTGLPAVRRRSGQAASVGAALIAARAIGARYDLDLLDPVVDTLEPDPSAVECYANLRDRADAAAAAVLALGEGGPVRGTDP